MSAGGAGLAGSIPDLLIVGGGIVGAACAWEAVRAGLRVTVVESGPIGGGASAAGMGHLVVMDDSDAQFALTRYSLDCWLELRPQLPDDAEYDPCGTLWIAADDEEMGEVRRKQAYLASQGAAKAIEVLDPVQLRQAEPALRDGLAGALRVIDDAVVYTPCVVRWLLDEVVRLGGEVRAGEVVELLPDGVRLADGARLSAGATVNAGGISAPRLTPGIPVVPRKGHLAITDRYPGWVRHQLVELGYLKSAHGSTSDSVAFNVQPRRTGQLLIGSSRQFGVETPEVEGEMLGRMLRRAVEYLPSIGDLSVLRVWAGFRPATPDNLPLIGRWPVSGAEDDRAVWLATGHEGLGITTSLGTARLLVDQIVGRPSPIPVEPYWPTRSSSNGEGHG
ncbi:MAG: NAD(P)/FAD-dependent oxidoreductase [Blastocatellia bacterium]